MKRSAKDWSAAHPEDLKKNPAAFRTPARRLIPVRFEFSYPEAITITVAGRFNSWHPPTKSQPPLGSSYWSLEAFLAPADYEYCLVVGGHGRPDPKNRASVPARLAARTQFYTWRNSPRQRIVIRRTTCH